MLTYLRTSIFESPAQTLVNTVNTIGVMGKGVAKDYKRRFPSMYNEYRALCDAGRLQIGGLHLWRGADTWILNFPTKTTWRKPSQLDYVEAGLVRFRESYEDMGISSISFPPLGCGNGNLDWRDVRPMMERYLSPLPIRVFVHDRQVKPGFVPEHLDGVEHIVPSSFERFCYDIETLILRNQGTFQTLRDGTPFNARGDTDNGLTITRDGKSQKIDFDELGHAWSVLQTGILSADQYSGEQIRRQKSYLFAILANLPYVQAVEIQNVRGGSTSRGHGLYFERDRTEFENLLEESPKQGDLWQSP